MVEEDPDIRTGKKIALGSYRTLLQDDESSGEEDSEVEEEPVHLEFEDDSGPASIETKKLWYHQLSGSRDSLTQWWKKFHFYKVPKVPIYWGRFWN